MRLLQEVPTVMERPEFVLQIVEAPESQSEGERPAGVDTLDTEVTAEVAYAALKATKGSAEVIAKLPTLADPTLWVGPLAFFSVCRKTGTARYLDLWDADHFDFVTDIQENIDHCRVWFAGPGYQTWGAPQTTTGRVNCYFTVPASGSYVINARLWGGSPSLVECIIDSSSYGPLTINGSIDQPHPANLGAGGHHFRIRQLSGPFSFVSLTVWRV